jgi:hypothetical protein
MADTDLKPPSGGFAFNLDTGKALTLPIGAASPLWLAFAGATGAGLAYWWISRWMRPANLEAWLGLPKAAMPEPEPMRAPMEVEAANDADVLAEDEPVVKAEPERVEEVVETVMEAASEPAEMAAEAEPIAEEAPIETDPATAALIQAASAAKPKTASKARPKKA